VIDQIVNTVTVYGVTLCQPFIGDFRFFSKNPAKLKGTKQAEGSNVNFGGKSNFVVDD